MSYNQYSDYKQYLKIKILFIIMLKNYRQMDQLIIL